MSIAVLTQVYDEIRRLSIAGSVVAVGDFRLRKLLPTLEQAGQKAPVFAKVAQAVAQLVDSSEQTSPAALLEVSSLINAMLYTQGEAGADGAWQALPGSSLGLQQQVAARHLKPLLEALSTTGSGRLEIVRDAHDQGMFRDLRLVLPAVAALDDVYPEIADLIADQVLPLYGTAIVPALRQRLDLQGRRRGDARRLNLLHRLDPGGTRPLVEQALESGSKEMRVAAIGCLGDHPDDMSFLLEQSRARAKDVRAAALSALARCDAAAATKRLQDAIAGNDLSLITGFQRVAPRVVELLRLECHKQWQRLHRSTTDEAAKEQSVARYKMLLNALQGQTDEATTALLIDMFQQRQVFAQYHDPMLEFCLVGCMAHGAAPAQRLLIESHATLSALSLPEALLAAIEHDTPEPVFERFGSYLGGFKKNKDKCQAVVDTLLRHDLAPRLDPRWLDLAVGHEHEALVVRLARPGHTDTVRFLGQRWRGHLSKTGNFHQLAQLLQAMVAVGHAESSEAVRRTIDYHAKSLRFGGWALHPVVRLGIKQK